jgi:sigma-B regulation protein RsbU (phosphoserine phosphatase)
MHNAEFTLAYENLSEIRGRIEDWVGRYNDKRLSGFVLITSEIITNLLKHASPKATLCRIEMSVEAMGSFLKIYDNGGCFDNFEDAKKAASNEFSEVLVSGMGLGLVSALVDDFSYTPGDALDETAFNCYQFEITASQQRTVVVVDDDVSILVLLEAYLEEHYRVLTFATGQSAIDGLAGKRVDLVISDLNMPELNGIQLREALQGGLGNIPFIFLTGEDTENLHRLAIDDVLHKPVKKQNLMQSVERVLIRHASLHESIGQQLSPSIVNQLVPRIKYQPRGYNILLASRATKSGGGDFLFQKDQSSGCLLLLADVMGHDQQAKFFVHAYQGFLQGMCFGLTDCSSPETLLYALSEGLRSDDLLASSLLTAVSVFCAHDGSISIAAAGHPAPKVLIDGQWLDSTASGPLLGFSDKPEYQAYHSPKGAPVLCFTDGLIENLTESEQTEFLTLLSASISQQNPCLSRAIDYYDNKAGATAIDDMTLMVILSK